MKGGFIPKRIEVLEEFFDRRFKQTAISTSFSTAMGFFSQPSGQLFADGLIILTLIALIRELKHQNKPIKVLGVTRTEDGKMRVDLENRSLKTYFMTSSIRVAHSPTKKEKKELSEIPMLAASSTNPEKVYDLLGGVNAPISIEPGEIKHVLIECSQSDVEVNPDRVSVSVEYGLDAGKLTGYLSRDLTVKKPKKHPYLRHVGKSRAFLLKKDHHEILDEVCMLEGLVSAVESAQGESISFHMREGNDFASWVGDVVGDKKLANILSEIKFTDSESTRRRLVGALRGRLIDLENEEFKGRHPNLGHVGEAYAFKLKSDHEQIIAEAAFLEELRDAISSSSSDVVIYHMQNGKNDFADWARDVLGDEALSEELRSVGLISPSKTKEHVAIVIDSRIKELEGGS